MEDKKNASNLWFWLVMACLVVLGMVYFRGADGTLRSYVGRSLPPIKSSGTWLNTAAPQSWDTLTGDVVWLEFSFLH